MEEKCGDYCELSVVECVAILVVAFPVDVVFTEFMNQPFRGFIAACSFGVILGLAWMLRPLARMPIFWLCISIAAALHLLIVILLPYTGEFRFGFAFFPLFFVDFYLTAKLIIAVCRRAAAK